MAGLALAFDILARDNASRTFDKVGRAADSAGRKGEGFGKGLGKGMAIAATALAGVGVAAVAGLGQFVKDAAESARIGRLTDAAIKSTGGAAKITAAQVGDLATAISNKTGIDDEAIQSGENLLLTFTNVQNRVGKGNDIFNRATQTITDMSAALGQDTKASAIQLGKALNDPIKGVTALQKVGVSFTQQQKDQIKTLVKSGDTLGAQKVILKELGKEFGGAAEAASDPMSRLKVITGNLGEQIGGLLLPYVGKLADWVANRAVPAISGFFDDMKNGTGVAGKVRDVIEKVVGAVQNFITEFQNGEGAGGKFRDILQKVVDVAQGVAKWIGDNATVVKSLVVAVLAGVGAFQTIVGVVRVFTAVQTVLNFVLAANPIGLVIVAVAALAAGLIYAYQNSETFRSYVSTAFSVVKIGALTLAKVAISAFQFIANVWLTVVGVLLNGAARAFGWVPGLGPKLQGAATEFGKFKDSANAKLNAIKNSIDINVRTEEANLALEALHREFINKGWTVTATANVRMVYGGNGQLVPARAVGGPVTAGHPYIVGEKRPELFVPDVNGRIIPRVPTGTGSTGAGFGGIDYDRLASAISAGLGWLPSAVAQGAASGTQAGMTFQAREVSIGGRR